MTENIDKKLNLPVLDARLMSAVGFVREGAFVADVGTDHAYLPIYLCGNGKIAGAVASDINEGPIERARANIALHGMDDSISAVLTDGLSGIEKYSPTDIIIFGMGGELIAKIIAEAKFVYREGVRLILQPMTHAEILCSFLAREGFAIVGETLSKAGKIYRTIAAEYTGESYEMPLSERYGGKYLVHSELYGEFIDRQIRVHQNAADGMRGAGKDASETEKIIEALKECRQKGERT